MSPPSRDWGREEALRELAEGEGGEDLPPIAMIVSPTEGTRYRAGEAITFAGRGSDPEEGALMATAFTWQVDFHDGDHVIPFVPPISGMGRGTFTVPVREQAGGSGWYRIHLTLTDSNGNTDEVFRDVHPEELRRAALVR